MEPFIRRERKNTRVSFSHCEDKGEGGHQQSTIWEEGLHQELDLLVSGSGTSQALEM